MQTNETVHQQDFVDYVKCKVTINFKLNKTEMKNTSITTTFLEKFWV